MRKRRATLVPTFVLCLVAGCATMTGVKPASTHTTAVKNPEVATASAGAGHGPGVTLASAALPGGSLTGNGGNIVSDNGGGVISNNGSSLSGIVTAPAGLIANNGGGVVSNNGSSFRLLDAAPALPVEQPVAGIPVAVQDAAGKAVLGPDGKPLTTVTDAKGAYAFTATLPGANLVVVATLAGNKGTLKGIAPRGDHRSVGVELISTLTTDYILTSYVATSSDPVATFERLPADAEATTRSLAAAAFASSGTIPTTLDDTAANAAVTSLRSQNPAFDKQMEVVKQLLVVAGVVDLGSGQKATAASFPDIRSLLEAPDGSTYLLVPSDNRIWKIGTDGILQDALGKLGHTPAPKLMLLDGTGNLVVAETNDLLFVAADGSVTTKPMPNGVMALLPGPNGTLTGVADGGNNSLVFYSFAPSGTETQLASTPQASPAPGSPFVAGDRYDSWATLPNGHVLALAFGQTSQHEELRDYDPTTATLTLIESPEGARWLDQAGNYFQLAAGSLQTRAATGGSWRSLGAAPTTLALQSVALSPDGKVGVFATHRTVYHLDGTGATIVAGQNGANSSTRATEFSFVGPNGLAGAPDGSLIVTDTGAGQVYRVDTDGSIAAIAGFVPADGLVPPSPANNGGVPTPPPTDGLPTLPTLSLDGQVALKTTLGAIKCPAIDANGKVYFAAQGPFGVGANTVVSLAQGGTVLHQEASLGFAFQQAIAAVAVDGAGVLDLSLANLLGLALGTSGNDAIVQHFSATPPVVFADATPGPPTVFTPTVSFQAPAPRILLSIGPKGLYGLYGDQPCFIDPVKGLVPIAPGTHFLATGGFCLDFQGRWYGAVGNTITRLDPVAGTQTVLAGKGSKVFAGDTLDNGIGQPMSPVIDAAGDLFFLDGASRQVRRLSTGSF